jgi:cell division protein ZapB
MEQAMVNEMSALEEKVRQAARLCHLLREENRGLRARIATLEDERRQLEERIGTASARLANLLSKIPE